MNPLIVTSAIIIKEDRFLLVKRAREPFINQWCLIGGTGAFKYVSNPIEAVKIEVKADIDCDYSPEFFTINYLELEVPAITLFYFGTITGNITINPKYVLEYKWFTKDEIKQLELGFDHTSILNKFFNKL